MNNLVANGSVISKSPRPDPVQNTFGLTQKRVSLNQYNAQQAQQKMAKKELSLGKGEIERSGNRSSQLRQPTPVNNKVISSTPAHQNRKSDVQAQMCSTQRVSGYMQGTISTKHKQSTKGTRKTLDLSQPLTERFMENTAPHLAGQLQMAREDVSDNDEKTLADFVLEETHKHKDHHNQSEHQINPDDFKPNEFFQAGKQHGSNPMTPDIPGKRNNLKNSEMRNCDDSSLLNDTAKENESDVHSKLSNIQAGKAYLEKKIQEYEARLSHMKHKKSNRHAAKKEDNDHVTPDKKTSPFRY